jgi:hypothetical protein
MTPDFRRADHLPKSGPSRPSDPYELPRQRRGQTPQGRGRYPDYDVLEQAGHWDEVTRRMVLDRVHNVPEISLFTAGEAATLRVLTDALTAQYTEPRIPIINFVDEKYAHGELDGYQYADMPDDRDAWRLVARGLDEETDTRTGSADFATAPPEIQQAIVSDFADGRCSSGAWEQLNVTRAFALVMRVTLSCFYSHPWAWNEIGFGGPAYPRGYSRFGSPNLQMAGREHWEGREAVDTDPVSERSEPAPGG